MNVLFGPLADRSPSAHRFLLSSAGQPHLAQLIDRVQHSSDAERIHSLAALGDQWLLQPLPKLLDSAVALHLLHAVYHNPQALDLKRLAWAKIQVIIEKQVSVRCASVNECLCEDCVEELSSFHFILIICYFRVGCR